MNGLIPFFPAPCSNSASAARGEVRTPSPTVQESSRRYSDVMVGFADQALLANLRARDQARVKFNDLSGITRFNVVFQFDQADGNSRWSFQQLVPVMPDGDPANPL